MTYDYDRRLLASAEDIPRLLGYFERALKVIEEKTPETLTRTPYGIKLEAETFFRGLVRYANAQLLFLSALSTYQMVPKHRKILEDAAKTFGKSRIVVRKGKERESYEALLRTWRLYFDTVKFVVEQGVSHAEEGDTVWKAGPFELVNTGGFPDKVMQEAKRVAELSAQHLTSRGLSRVCYGKIQVTNTVHKSTRVLAFYMRNTDELFIRANLKGKQGPAVTSLTHELGHRLHRRFLKSKDREIQNIYQTLLRGEDKRLDAMLDDKSWWPDPGEEFVEGQRTYIVENVVYPNVLLYRKDDPTRKARTPLKGWLSLQTREESDFVSSYAKTSYSENFAEMIAHYCEGTLPEPQVNMLKGVL